MIGKRIGRYRVLEKLGEGGMGEVFLAEDTELHRNVALKFMAEEFASEPNFISRFKREARAAAALNHPNIVTVHEVGEHEGRPFIAMSFVDGGALSDLVDGGCEAERAVELAAQICDGLQSAHAAGIVHRDIKPDNILIDSEGRPKILDFGLAKLKGVSRHSGDRSTLGTIYYMSPEQARGEDVDHRSDLFSVGALLYELLTGRSPFKREHAAAILYSIINEDPAPPTSLNPALSPGLEAVVMRALAKDRDERYQSAAEMAADLRSMGVGRHRGRRRFAAGRLAKILLPTSVVFLGVLLIAIFKPFSVQITPDQEAVAAQNSLAIMYFENLVDREDPKRLGEIVTNLLITDLSESEYIDVVSSQRLYDILKREGMEEAKVIDRTTATEVATSAGANWMLLGSILQEEPNFILTARLVDVESGKIVASQRITGEPGEEIFALVDELTSEVKSDLALPAAARRETDTPVADATTHSTEAYRYYLEGMDNLNKYYGKEALASFKKALEHDSTMAAVHLAMAGPMVPTSRREKLKSINTALRYAKGVSKKDKLYMTSTKARLSGNIEAARGDLEAIVREFPGEKEAYKALGDICRRYDRDTDKAIEMYRKAIDVDPLDKTSYNLLAYLYQARGDIDNYIWAIYQYMMLAPNEANPYDTRGDLYAFSGKIDKAIKSYGEALERKPDFYPSIAKTGHMYLFMREYEQARASYRKLVAGDDAKTRSDGRLLLALIPLHQGQFKAALEVLDQGIAADEAEGYSSGSYAEKFGAKSMILCESGRFDEADAALTKCESAYQKTNPDDPLGWRGHRIYELALRGDVTGAEKALAGLKTAIEGFDRSRMYEYWLGSGWVAIAKGDYEAACTAFETAAGPSQSFPFRYPLALAYYKAGRLGEAIHEFEALLRRYSEDRAWNPIWSVRAHYYLGLAYEESGSHENAVEEYETFLTIWKKADDGIKEVTNAKSRLKALRVES